MGCLRKLSCDLEMRLVGRLRANASSSQAECLERPLENGPAAPRPEHAEPGASICAYPPMNGDGSIE